MKYPLLKLKPTQFAVGMREVNIRAAELRKLGKNRLREFLRERPVPVVVSAEGKYFIVDRHHLARACRELELEEVYIEKRADLSHLGRYEFWEALIHSRWTYLYDERGGGPHDPATLPRDIRGLADDPYRSLAWEVRRQGGYDKSNQPFAEFTWAQFLRERVEIGRDEKAFKRAIEEALRLARTPEAKGLPGCRVRGSRSMLARLKDFLFD